MYHNIHLKIHDIDGKYKYFTSIYMPRYRDISKLIEVLEEIFVYK